jgi:hypothetical protein
LAVLEGPEPGGLWCLPANVSDSSEGTGSEGLELDPPVSPSPAVVGDGCELLEDGWIVFGYRIVSGIFGGSVEGVSSGRVVLVPVFLEGVSSVLVALASLLAMGFDDEDAASSTCRAAARAITRIAEASILLKV